MLHASLVGACELPANIALYEVDSLLPVICFNHSGKHDKGRFDDQVCDGIVWVDDGEADVPVVSFIWDFRSCPVWFVCEGYIFEEGVRIFDLFQELVLGPQLAHVHGITIELFVSDCSTWDLSVDQFVPNHWFGKGDVGISLCKDIDDGFSRVFNIFVLGFVCECDRKIVLFGPSGKDSFDLIHLLTGYVDLVDNDVCWGLYAFPWGFPTEAEGVDLPMLERRSFGLGIDWSRGFVWSELTSCCRCKRSASFWGDGGDLWGV